MGALKLLLFYVSKCIKDKIECTRPLSIWQALSSSPSSIKQSFVMGLFMMLLWVLMLTVRTSPFWSGKTSIILPTTQEPLGAVGSTTKATSPHWKFLLLVFHFWLSWSSGKYS